MRISKLATSFSLLALAVLPLAAVAPVPRPSPALTVTDAAGKPIQLASFHGKVVVVEFLLAHCPHCWRLAQTVGKLQQDLGPKGLQPLGVAFDTDITAAGVADLVQRARFTFPVGSTSASTVDAYLGRAGAERLQVPQIVVIDRAGVIRAQSHPTGEKTLEDEAQLRKLLEGLLAEKPPAAR